jgi:hypothetical protein
MSDKAYVCVDNGRDAEREEAVQEVIFRFPGKVVDCNGTDIDHGMVVVRVPKSGAPMFTEEYCRSACNALGEIKAGKFLDSIQEYALRRMILDTL